MSQPTKRHSDDGLRLALATLVALCVCTPACRMTESSNAQVALNAQQLDPADRIRAIWAIVATGDSGFVPELMQRLEDEDAAVRLFAKEALTRLADFTWDAPMLDPDLLSQAADQWDGYPIDAPPWRMISSHDFPAGATLNR